MVYFNSKLINLVAGPRGAIGRVPRSWVRYPICHILSFLLPLIQEGQLSVTGESTCLCTKYWLMVYRLGGLSLSRKSVVRLTDRPDMTLDVYRGR